MKFDVKLQEALTIVEARICVAANVAFLSEVEFAGEVAFTRLLFETIAMELPNNAWLAPVGTLATRMVEVGADVLDGGTVNVDKESETVRVEYVDVLVSAITALEAVDVGEVDSVEVGSCELDSAVVEATEVELVEDGTEEVEVKVEVEVEVEVEEELHVELEDVEFTLVVAFAQSVVLT